MRFNKRHVYDFWLNEHNKKIEEFWSLKDDEQLALQEQKQEDVILKGTKEAVETVVDGTVPREKVREEKKNLANTNDKSFLTFLENDKLLILPKPKSLPMTEFFLLENDSNQVLTPKPKVCKPWGKAPIPPPSNRETCVMTGSSKCCFRYINSIAFSH